MAIKNYIFTLKTMQESESSNWLIENHFFTNTINCVYGQTATKKTFYCLDLALSVAHGVPFLGKFPTQQRKVFYVLSEGGGKFKRRIKAWKKSSGIAYQDNQLHIAKTKYYLNNSSEIERLRADLLVTGCENGLLIIDTFAKNIDCDETDNSKISKILGNLDSLAAGKDLTILLVHHSGKDTGKGERGGSAFRAGIDSSFELCRGNSDKINVRNRKQKDGEDGLTYQVRSVKDQELDTLTLELVDLVEEKREIIRGIEEEILSLIPVADPYGEISGISMSDLRAGTSLGEKKIRKHLKDWIESGAVFEAPRLSMRDPCQYYRTC